MHILFGVGKRIWSVFKNTVYLWQYIWLQGEAGGFTFTMCPSERWNDSNLIYKSSNTVCRWHDALHLLKHCHWIKWVMYDCQQEHFHNYSVSTWSALSLFPQTRKKKQETKANTKVLVLAAAIGHSCTRLKIKNKTHVLF